MRAAVPQIEISLMNALIPLVIAAVLPVRAAFRRPAVSLLIQPLLGAVRSLLVVPGVGTCL